MSFALRASARSLGFLMGYTAMQRYVNIMSNKDEHIASPVFQVSLSALRKFCSCG